jgi:hypothetical protein
VRIFLQALVDKLECVLQRGSLRRIVRLDIAELFQRSLYECYRARWMREKRARMSALGDGEGSSGQGKPITETGKAEAGWLMGWPRARGLGEPLPPWPVRVNDQEQE